MNRYSTVYAYVLAYCFVTVGFVYGLRGPYWITGEKPLVDLYYRTNYSTNLILDFFLVAVYMAIAIAIGHRLKWDQVFWKQLLIILLTTIVISGGFCYYFLSKPLSQTNFFSRWFHRVGYHAVIYDVVLLGITYCVYYYLLDRFNP